MFVGHYGVAFGAKPLTPVVPLWVYFIAVQWLDVVWSILVLLGVEKLHIVPGFTPPSSATAMAVTALGFYIALAALAAAVERVRALP